MFLSFTVKAYQRNSWYESCLSPTASAYTMCWATWQAGRLRKKSWKVGCLCLLYQKCFPSTAAALLLEISNRETGLHPGQTKNSPSPIHYQAFNKVPWGQIHKNHDGLQHVAWFLFYASLKINAFMFVRNLDKPTKIILAGLCRS